MSANHLEQAGQARTKRVFSVTWLSVAILAPMCPCLPNLLQKSTIAISAKSDRMDGDIWWRRVWISLSKRGLQSGELRSQLLGKTGTRFTRLPIRHEHDINVLR
jgi:hypothetical protein